MWTPRKNAKPATAAALSVQIAAATADLTACESEHAEIEHHLATLAASDPARAAEASARLAVLSVDIPTKRRTLALLEDARIAAEAREQRGALEARLDAQRRASSKLARDLEARYVSASETLRSILREMEADADACDRLNDEARAAGLGGVEAAEFGLRKNCKTGHVGFETLTAMRVFSWSGGSGFPLK